MENKEKKANAYNGANKRKRAAGVRDDSGYVNKRNQTTGVSERNRRPGHLLGHVSTSAERSRTSVGISTGTCAGTKFPARCISGGELEPGLFTVGASAVFGKEASPDKV